MLKNYLKIAIRKAIRDKAYTIINLLGLAISLASFFFISRYIDFERNVDSFHANYSTIYRLHSDLKWNEVNEVFPQTAPAVGTAIAVNFGEVEFVTRIHPFYREQLVKVEEKVFQESGIVSVDSNFLNVFSFEIINGNPDKLFVEPNQVVLTESISKKYFGKENGLNKTIEIEQRPFVVSGIIEDAPTNSHIQYTVLVSNLSDEDLRYFEWSWVWCNLVTYVKLNDQADPDFLESKFPELVMKNAGGAIERITGKSIEAFFEKGNSLGYKLEPLSEVYYSGFNPIGTSGSRTFIYIFGIVAFTILLLACINYMNLTTARSIKRAKEIGLRKVVGTTRMQLHLQFLLESLLFSLLATIFAVFIYESLNNIIKHQFNVRWDLGLLNIIPYIWFILGVALIVGLFSGLYPAFFLSSFSPSKALKGIQLKGQTKSPLRNWLVVFQFIISFCIIIFTFTVNSQIRFLRNRDLGFEKENLVVINNIDQLQNRNVFKDQVNQNTAVISSTLSSDVPSLGGHGELFRRMQGKQEDFIMTMIDADQDFISTFGINLNEGSNFTANDLISNSPKVVVNKKAAKILEFQDAIGETIMGLDDGRVLEISGVIEDFDYYLSQVELRPIIIRPYIDNAPENAINHLSVKVSSHNLQKTISDIAKIWNQQKTGIPFQYHFYDQIFNDMYVKEIRLGNLLSIFSGLAITIAILGLIGLISFHIGQLTKSIGIRKVFGANVMNILSLITRDFLKLFIIAFVIAIPIANYAMKDWLEAFIYKMNMNIWLFIVPGAIVIFIALSTIWIQSFKSATANPVDAIRNE